MTAFAETAPLTRPPLLRLSRVELRKMVDTRAGAWLLATVGLIAVAAVVLILTVGDAADQDLATLLSSTVGFTGVLLPVVGILAVTSEWTQRTALTTFTLVPERGRVIASKLLAALALGLLTGVACLVAAAAGNVIAGGSWSLQGDELGGAAFYMLLVMLGGFAFGALFLNSAVAIVLSFALPTILSILGEMIKSLPDEWLNTGLTFEPLLEGTMGGSDWAKLATSVAIWILLPLVIGIVRLRRAEVKSA